MTADANHTHLGAAVAGAGDLDGDGLSEFIITSHAQTAKDSTVPVGRVDVFRGLRSGYGMGEKFPADGAVCVAGDFTVETRKLRARETFASATNIAGASVRALAETQRKARARVSVFGGMALTLSAAVAWLWFNRRRVRREAVHHERERLARDLHDGLGSGVHRLQRLTELLNQVGADSPEAHRYRDELSQTAQELGGSMDHTIWGVKPENDTLENLVSYLAGYAPSVLQLNGIECELDLPAKLPARVLHSDTRQHLFLAVNEALNNVVKHSHARHAWLGVAWSEPWLEFVVEDDGRGLEETVTRAGGGTGLKNLRARLRALQGSAELSPRAGGGTRLMLRLPL